MALVRWDPWNELNSLQTSINKLFDDSFALPRKSEQAGFIQGWMVPVDVKETADSVVLKAEVPGLSKEDVKISFADNQLTIRGERRKEEKEEGERFLRVERSYGGFSRTFMVDVPVKAEEIRARYQDGVLEITLPKREEIKPKEITIDVEE